MFKKLFSRDKPSPVILPTDSSIHQPLVTGKAGLLAQFSNQISLIAQTSGVSTPVFNDHFLPVISQLLFTFQSLPATRFSTHERLYGLADLCLLAGLNALKIRRGMILPPGVRTDLIDAQRAQWSFVVFCAGLALVIREDLSQWQIETSVNAEQFESWDVTSGALGNYPFFRFRKTPCDDASYAVACSSALMGEWIEASTQAWLVSDKQVYGELSAVINCNQSYCPVLKDFLTVDLIFSNREVATKEPDQQTVESSEQPTSETNTPLDSIKPDFEHPFFIWLFKEIAGGGLIFNTESSLVHSVESRVFIRQSIARKYAQASDDNTVTKQTITELLIEQCREVSYEAYDDVLVGFEFNPGSEIPDLAQTNPALKPLSEGDSTC